MYSFYHQSAFGWALSSPRSPWTARMLVSPVELCRAHSFYSPWFCYTDSLWSHLLSWSRFSDCSNMFTFFGPYRMIDRRQNWINHAGQLKLNVLLHTSISSIGVKVSGSYFKRPQESPLFNNRWTIPKGMIDPSTSVLVNMYLPFTAHTENLNPSKIT